MFTDTSVTQVLLLIGLTVMAVCGVAIIGIAVVWLRSLPVTERTALMHQVVAWGRSQFRSQDKPISQGAPVDQVAQQESRWTATGIFIGIVFSLPFVGLGPYWLVLAFLGAGIFGLIASKLFHIVNGSFKPGGTFLYGATLLLELPSALMRAALLWLLLSLMQAFVLAMIWVAWMGADGTIWTANQRYSQLEPWIAGVSIFVLIVSGLFGFGNIVLSVLTFLGKLLPFSGGLFTRMLVGARLPSQRERHAYITAFEPVSRFLNEHNKEELPGINTWHYWYVVDSLEPTAHLIGSTLYINRQLLHDQQEHLPAVLAHQLGHFNASDGQLTLALRRLVMPWVYLLDQVSGAKRPAPGAISPSPLGRGLIDPRIEYLLDLATFFFNVAVSLANGGIGLVILNPLWTWYWRERDYHADYYAFKIHQAGNLVGYIEGYELVLDVATPFYLSPTPYAELRLDKLRQWQTTEEAVKAVGMSPEELAQQGKN